MTCLCGLDDVYQVGSLSKLSTGHYDLGYRFDLSKPVKIAIESFNMISAAAYARAALSLQGLVPGLKFIPDDKSVFEGPFENKIIYAEVNSSQPWFGVALAGYAEKGEFKSCYGHDWGLEFETASGIIDLVGANITGDLTGQKVANCGLVLFNQQLFDQHFDGEDDLIYKIYLATHETLHLFGLGHRRDSIMQPGIADDYHVKWLPQAIDGQAVAELGY